MSTRTTQDTGHYPERANRPKDPQAVTVVITVNEAGKIDRCDHEDPAISTSRGDTIEWICRVEGNDQVEFKISDFKNACPIACSHPETPFPALKERFESASVPIKSGPLDAKAGGGFYKSTWTVRTKNASGGWDVDVWDPHVIVHNGD